MQQNIIRLESAHSDVILRCFPWVEILYWGPHLNHFDAQMSVALERPVPNSRLDNDVPLTLCPENGRGLFSVPGIEGHRDGLDWAPVFTPVDYRLHDNRLTITQQDDTAGLRLTSELYLCPHSGVLSHRNTLTNLKAGVYQLARLALTLPLPERARQVMAFHGRWIDEFQRHSLTLDHGGFLQENRRGRTSHEYFPGVVIGSDGFSEQQGEVWGLHLAWSGNHRLRVDCKSDGRRQIQAEALYFAGEIALEDQQSISTPWIYATYAARGLNAMSEHFHRYVRAELIAGLQDKPRPVHLNTWEGIYFDHQPDNIITMAQRAASLGIERFIIDDGWFKGRVNDHFALGDWYVDAEKYPQGLTPVIAAVKATGMEFGIWVEPEMVNEDSDLFRRHPDWLLKLDGYPLLTGRNQLVLDLCRPEVYEYLLERLSWLLGQHDIDYVKWDFNRELVQPGHHGRPAMVAQTEQLYRLFDALNQRFPQVEFESCASGGGRIDYEILKRCKRFWPSDSNDALDRQQIQRGMSYFFPPEVMGTHIGGNPCHSTSRILDVNFRGLTALFGHMGVELDPLSAPEEEQQAFARYIALHKHLRPLLHSGVAFRLDTPDDILIHGVRAQDGSRAVAMVSQLTLPHYALSGTLRVPGLKSGALYRVSVLDKPQSLNKARNHTMKVYPRWLREEVVLSGEWLEQVGLPLPVLDPASAILLSFDEIDAAH
ncbi:alpha-galactosidase [Affinibrenneria salicis]|uniref:Alpha-galactosidase n=1 Tax=Affinibrenneria salicis TaxID=2590031 RepID=A0A5J5FXS2_9GAMM|nr:alpha-galactosidase [Affinibrenneria salicis]KAA8998906.1 alpha-galactosidase [Affinibrenneria salicis]